MTDMFSDLRVVPFLKGGRDSKVGLDCLGLCEEISRRVGEEVPDFPSPDCREDIDEIVQREKGRFERLENAQPFAWVLFAIHPPYESHIGRVLQDRKHFIHTSAKTGCCVERLDNPFWVKRIKGFFRYGNL